MRKGFAVPLAVGLACGLAAFLPDSGRSLLGYERALVLGGQWWRLVTAHLAHLSGGHALMNLLALGLVTWLFADGLDSRGWAAAMLVSGLAIGLGLLWAYPDVGWYVGLSGVLHGLVVVGGLNWLRRGDRTAGLVLLAALGGKLVYEAVVGPLPGSASAAGGPVLVEAHQLGAMGGVAYAAGAWAAGHWRRLYSRHQGQ